MGFELPDGKTARNIQDQVKFLTEKLKDLYAAFNQSGLKKIEIVEELPEVGKPNVLYLLPITTPDDNNYYEEYLWLDDQWEMIGTTQIDLSNYPKKDQTETITGEWTFNNKIIASNGVSNITIINNGWTSTITQGDGGVGIRFSSEDLSPTSNANKDLGSLLYTWRDIYISGKLSLKGENYSGYIQNINNRLMFYYDGAERFRIGNSEVVSNNPILPYAGNTYDLGSSSFTWKDFYVGGKIYTAYEQGLYDGTNSKWVLRFNASNGVVDTAYNFCPISSANIDLGASFRKWRNLYLSNNLTDGTNTVSVAEIQSKVYRHVITGITLPSGFGGSSTLVVESKTAAAFATIGDLYNDCESNAFRNFYILTIDQGNEVSRAPVIRLAPNGTNIEIDALNISGGAVQAATATIGSITTTITDTVSSL